MDKRSLKNIALLVIFVLYTLLYKGFIFPNYMKYSDIINASFFIVFLFGAIKCLGYRKDKMTIYYPKGFDIRIEVLRDIYSYTITIGDDYTRNFEYYHN